MSNEKVRLLFFIDNMVKLLDQHGDWFVRYADFKLSGRIKEAEAIAEKYLRPLDRKIKSLAERASREL